MTLTLTEVVVPVSLIIGLVAVALQIMVAKEKAIAKKLKERNSEQPKHLIKINILGYTGSGKSSLAYAIAELCKDHGISATVNEQDETNGVLKKQWNRRLNTISGKTAVEINTIQLSRMGIHNP